MASRALTKVAADWSKISSQVHPSEVPKLNRLKSRIDATAVKVASLPDSLPKIDWAYYKANASNPKMVEEIEKKYSSLKIDAPKAPEERLAELKRAQEQTEKRYQKFVEVAKSYIDSATEVEKKFKDMIPVKDMMLEEYSMTFPEWSFQIENPSLAPHYGRWPGLTREEAAAFEQPDPVPYSTKTAWKDWEVRKKKYFSD